MRALCQSRGWLPILETPGYSRHPTSILRMQLLTLYIINFYFDSHQWSHKVSLLRTKSYSMQQEEGKSLAIIIIDFKVNFAQITFTHIIFIVMHFKLSAKRVPSVAQWCWSGLCPEVPEMQTLLLVWWDTLHQAWNSEFYWYDFH